MEILVNKAFNFSLGIIIFLLLIPAFLLIGILIVADSPGNPIFIQKRFGKNKKIFWMYKFRTMKIGAEKERESLERFNISSGPIFRMRRDPRITRLGKFLRRGFDEMPQLTNIIKGEMDLVGPRPFPVNEAKKIDKKYDLRFSVNPGIASPALLDLGRHKDFDNWMKSDLDYLEKKSIFFDIIVLLKTLKIIF